MEDNSVEGRVTVHFDPSPSQTARHTATWDASFKKQGKNCTFVLVIAEMLSPASR